MEEKDVPVNITHVLNIIMLTAADTSLHVTSGDYNLEII